MTDREQGEFVFKLWYDASAVKLDHSFDDVVDLYDEKSPTFLENFGRAAKQSELSERRLREAMASLASKSPKEFPHRDLFFEALVGEVQTFRAEDLSKVIQGTISDIKSTATVGFAVAVPLILIAVAVYAYASARARRAA